MDAQVAQKEAQLLQRDVSQLHTYVLSIQYRFLGATTGSPYIVFISTSGMLSSPDIYMYIYICMYNTCSYV